MAIVENKSGRAIEVFAAGESYSIPEGFSRLEPHRKRELKNSVSEETLLTLALGAHGPAGLRLATQDEWDASEYAAGEAAAQQAEEARLAARSEEERVAEELELEAAREAHARAEFDQAVEAEVTRRLEERAAVEKVAAEAREKEPEKEPEKAPGRGGTGTPSVPSSPRPTTRHK